MRLSLRSAALILALPLFSLPALSAGGGGGGGGGVPQCAAGKVWDKGTEEVRAEKLAAATMTASSRPGGTLAYAGKL